MNLNRMSLNQASIKQWTLPEAIEGCAHFGVPQIGLWRDRLAELPISTVVRQLRDAGVAPSSLCRGGFFSAPSAAERAARLDDNRRALDECAEVGAPLLVLVCGPADGQTLPDARLHVRDALAEIVPYAQVRGVRLGIEPLHPMYAADRSVVVSLEQANDLAEALPAHAVGVVVDAFHVWWDPMLERELARCGPRLCGFHVSDWLVPLPDVLLGRGVMGDGVIDLPGLIASVTDTGYTGIVEVEIFNRELWSLPGEEAMRRICTAFQAM